MPMEISLMLIAIWFCVGFFVGMGWALGTLIIAKLASKL